MVSLKLDRDENDEDGGAREFFYVFAHLPCSIGQLFKECCCCCGSKEEDTIENLEENTIVEEDTSGNVNNFEQQMENAIQNKKNKKLEENVENN